MSRKDLVLLGLLATVLISGGTTNGSRTAVGASDADLGSVAVRVASLLHRVNPSLSRDESDRIGAAVARYSAKYAIDPQLVTAVLLVESSARPWARSNKGAIGLMQVMPHVVASYGVAGNLTTIENNVEAGCLILADNIRRLGEDDGISAYFWGSRIRDTSYLERVKETRDAVGASWGS